MRIDRMPGLRIGDNRMGPAKDGKAALLLWLPLFSTVVFAGGSTQTNEPPRHDRGYSYLHEEAPEIPWSIHVFKIERARNDLEFCTTLGRGDTIGMATVSDQVKTLRPELGVPLAAINGDFYGKKGSYQGRPRDLQIRLGELISEPAGHSCFWIDPEGRPCMTNVFSRFQATWPDGTTTPFGLNEDRDDDSAVLYTGVVGAFTRTTGGVDLALENATNGVWLPLRAGQGYLGRVRAAPAGGGAPIKPGTMVMSLGRNLAARLRPIQPGAIVKFATETEPNLAGVKMAIGGGPALVRDGKALEWSGIIHIRHPRTALGWNKDYIFLVEVDGRQRDLSVGMTFAELAAYLIKLGCEQAINFDGGGSSTLWVMGNVMNSPSEGQERPAANALVVLRKKPAEK